MGRINKTIVDLYDIEELWGKNPKDFNKWRQENDLPILFNYFKGKLPGFNEWLKEYEPEPGYFLKIIPTGSCFKGDSSLVIVEYERSDVKGKIMDVVSSVEDVTNISKKFDHIQIKIIRTAPFIPYLHWGKKRLRKNKFIMSDVNNSGRSDSFVYNLRTSPSSNPKASRVFLFKEFSPLKLGNIRLSGRYAVGGRNLDFVDLDDLSFEQRSSTSGWSRISFSSARNVVFSKAVEPWYSFFEFYDCNIDNMRIQDCKIQDFRFVNNRNMEITFDHVDINKLSFKNSQVRMSFNRCDIGEELNYVPARDNGYKGVFNNYRKIRTAFQNIGKRGEASKFYYLERYYETKMLGNFVLNNSDSFPIRRKYSGSFFNVLEQLRDGTFGIIGSIKHFWEVLLLYLKIMFIPKYSFLAMKLLIRHFISLLDCLIWGYGEKPSRIIFFGISIVTLFSFIFYNSHHSDLNGSISDSLYFSVATFTTLGYGNINPEQYSSLKLLCSVEAIFGVFTMGLIVAGFANKARY